jgi:aspartokinase/homoserine dehydrogenase 1
MVQKRLVMKFGGTSVGSSEGMAQVVDIISQMRTDWSQVMIVISALSGVTDLLLKCSQQAVSGKDGAINEAAKFLLDRHTEIAADIITEPTIREGVTQDVQSLIEEFSNLCNAICVLGESTPRALDALLSLGERMSVRILAGALQSRKIPSQFLEATHLIITDDHFQNAHPDLDVTGRKSREVIQPLLETGIIPIITGFMAATPYGVTTTLGRGGSDYTAALIATAMDAAEVWIWTDVDGVMTADPHLVPNAKTIKELSYREVSELAYFGARVLHPKTIRPVIEAGIGLWVRNTFDPSNPGTQILDQLDQRKGGNIKAVTIIEDQCLITIEGRGMLGVPGVAARTFAAVATTGTSVALISQASSEQSICFAAPSQTSSRVITSLEKTFSAELECRDIDHIWGTDDVTIVTVVGAGMRNTPGISGRVFSALGVKDVNVIAIAQGSSEVSISLVVDAGDTQAALLALHELINKEC